MIIFYVSSFLDVFSIVMEPEAQPGQNPAHVVADALFEPEEIGHILSDCLIGWQIGGMVIHSHPLDTIRATPYALKKALELEGYEVEVELEGISDPNGTLIEELNKTLEDPDEGIRPDQLDNLEGEDTISESTETDNTEPALQLSVDEVIESLQAILETTSDIETLMDSLEQALDVLEETGQEQEHSKLVEQASDRITELLEKMEPSL